MIDPSAPETRKLIQRWIGAPETGNLSDPKTVKQLLKDIKGLDKHIVFKDDHKQVTTESGGGCVAIVIGHYSIDFGAMDVRGISEYELMKNSVAPATVSHLKDYGIEGVIFKHKGLYGYNNRQKDTASCIKRWEKKNNKKFDCHIELHFNSANATAAGYEYLYFKGSTKGKALAQSFLDSHEKNFPDRVKRGVKPVGKSDRGGGFLRLTNAPRVICEPYFGSNWEEVSYYGQKINLLSKSYAEALSNFIKNK